MVLLNSLAKAHCILWLCSRHPVICITSVNSLGMINDGHLNCLDLSSRVPWWRDSPKMLLGLKHSASFPLFILFLVNFHFVSAFLTALLKFTNRLVSLLYAAPLGDFPVEQLCEISCVLSSVDTNHGHLFCNGHCAKACRVKGSLVAVTVSLCFGVILCSVLILSLFACLWRIIEGQELTCSRSWKFWK